MSESERELSEGNARSRPRFWGKYTKLLMPGMLLFVAMGYGRDWRAGTGLAVIFVLTWGWVFTLWLLSDRWAWARARTEALERGYPTPRKRIPPGRVESPERHEKGSAQ